MYNELRKLQLFAGLLSILLLVTSVVLFVRQTPLTSTDISKGQTEDSGLQDSFMTSYIPHNPIWIASNTDFASQGFPGSGTIEDPYMISGFNITSTETCIAIKDTDAYFVISDCLITGGTLYRCIALMDVIHGTIQNNTISGHNFGVYLGSASNNTVVNNTIIDSNYVLSLGGSSYNTIGRNTIDGKDIGIILGGSFNIVQNNNISGNPQTGLSISYASHNAVLNNTISRNLIGLTIFESLNNTIEHNNISGNIDSGVWMYESSCNTVANNRISGNLQRGVHIHSSSDDNLIYLNVIADNDQGNAYDDGTNNHWNITGVGNYWSDYAGTGVYNILGGADAIDYHPFIYQSETTIPPQTTTDTTTTAPPIDTVTIQILILGGIGGIIIVLILMRYRRGI